MFVSTNYNFKKHHYSVFVPRKTAASWSISLSHHFEYAVIELSSFSRTPDRFSFPRRVQVYQFHCGRSFVLSNPPPSPEHWFSFLTPQDAAGWSTKLFPFLDMSTNFFISFCLFVTLQRKQKMWWMQSTRDAWREKENVVACSWKTII